jgi:cysteine sulfinate desulfinase/cysteine desulfurase-like protein
MGLSDEAAAASLRFSLGKYSTRAQVQEALAIMKQAVEEQRSLFDPIHS